MTTEPERRSLDVHPEVVGRTDSRQQDRRRTTASVLRMRRRVDRQLHQYDAALQRSVMARVSRPAVAAALRTPVQLTPQPRSGETPAAPRVPCPGCDQAFPRNWLVRHLATAHPGYRG